MNDHRQTPDLPGAGPRLLIIFLAASLTVVAAVVVGALSDSYWADGGAVALTALLLGLVLREVRRELNEDEK